MGLAEEANATDVNITCTVTQATMFIGPNMMRANIDGPWNFIITDAGLQTPWGKECALMKGDISASHVSVSCDGKELSFEIVIDRKLGTYNQTIRGTTTGKDRMPIVTTKSGTCQKRESF